MKFENIALLIGVIFFSVVIIIVAEKQEATQPRKIDIPIGIQTGLKQMCMALEDNPDIVERDVAFLQFKYNICEG